jgi:hypothetical protein
MKQIVFRILRFVIISLIKKHQPTIIGITGNVGKTTTRNNLVQFLSQFSQVGTNIDNYNTPLGICLSFLNLSSPGSNPFGWIIVSIKALWVYVFGISDVFIKFVGLCVKLSISKLLGSFKILSVSIF